MMLKMLFLSVLVMGTVVQAQKAPKQPLQFIKSTGVVLIEFDPNKETLTVGGPAIAMDQWICGRYEHGKSCKRASEVVKFILQDGVEPHEDTGKSEAR
jgi:hypothetical protein